MPGADGAEGGSGADGTGTQRGGEQTNSESMRREKEEACEVSTVWAFERVDSLVERAHALQTVTFYSGLVICAIWQLFNLSIFSFFGPYPHL